jgi:hypothetical protein
MDLDAKPPALPTVQLPFVHNYPSPLAYGSLLANPPQNNCKRCSLPPPSIAPMVLLAADVPSTQSSALEGEQSFHTAASNSSGLSTAILTLQVPIPVTSALSSNPGVKAGLPFCSPIYTLGSGLSATYVPVPKFSLFKSHGPTQYANAAIPPSPLELSSPSSIGSASLKPAQRPEPILIQPQHLPTPPHMGLQMPSPSLVHFGTKIDLERLQPYIERFFNPNLESICLFDYLMHICSVPFSKFSIEDHGVQTNSRGWVIQES